MLAGVARYQVWLLLLESHSLLVVFPAICSLRCFIRRNENRDNQWLDTRQCHICRVSNTVTRKLPYYYISDTTSARTINRTNQAVRPYRIPRPQSVLHIHVDLLSVQSHRLALALKYYVATTITATEAIFLLTDVFVYAR